MYFSKILGIPNSSYYPRTSFGSACHAANEYAMKTKISGEQPEIHKMHKIFQDLFKADIPKINVWADETPEHFLEEGRKSINDFYYNWVPQLNPIDSEINFRIERGEGKLPITCFADLITGDANGIPDSLWDYKYGRSSRPINYVLNMATYAYAFRQHYGVEPKSVKFLCAKWYQKTIEGKKFHFFSKHYVVELPITKDWEQTFFKIYNEVEKGINADIWLPAPDGTGLCKNCGYRLDGHCDVITMEDIEM